MISKLLLTLTIAFSWLLAGSVVLSGAHASYAASLNHFSVSPHRQTASTRKPDDGSTFKVPSDPHNHVDKHSLKSLHKSVINSIWMTENRQTKSKQKVKSGNGVFKLFGTKLLESFGLASA